MESAGFVVLGCLSLVCLRLMHFVGGGGFLDNVSAGLGVEQGLADLVAASANRCSVRALHSVGAVLDS